MHRTLTLALVAAFVAAASAASAHPRPEEAGLPGSHAPNRAEKVHLAPRQGSCADAPGDAARRAPDAPIPADRADAQVPRCRALDAKDPLPAGEFGWKGGARVAPRSNGGLDPEASRLLNQAANGAIRLTLDGKPFGGSRTGDLPREGVPVQTRPQVLPPDGVPTIGRIVCENVMIGCPPRDWDEPRPACDPVIIRRCRIVKD
ncbi:MAG: hypothetical protein HY078_09640 [Elusimicrobia bacterium]|nr:hypothetical protein [Elusimicrobiota bacterium]